MKTLTVIGANAGTGRHVVTQALDRGHRVVAAVRDPATSELDDDRLTVVRASLDEPDTLTEALDRADAVVAAVGARGRGPSTVHAALAELVVAHGGPRLVTVTAAPAGPWQSAKLLTRRVAFPLLWRLFGNAYADMRILEQRLAASTIDWTVLRPPRLVNGEPTGYRISTSAPYRAGARLTRADLATALLDAVEDKTLVRQAAWVTA